MFFRGVLDHRLGGETHNTVCSSSRNKRESDRDREMIEYREGKDTYELEG